MDTEKQLSSLMVCWNWVLLDLKLLLDVVGVGVHVTVLKDSAKKGRD